MHNVGIKGYAVVEAVAEAPKGVARALLYSQGFLLHLSFKTFYHRYLLSSRTEAVIINAIQSNVQNL